MSEGPKILAVMYHHGRPRKGSRYPELSVKTPEVFSNQLEALTQLAAPLEPERMAAWLFGKETLKAGDYFCLTFEDGFRDQIQWAAQDNGPGCPNRVPSA